MHCHEVNDLLSAYIDGMLDPSEHALVAQHLEECSLCRQECRDIKDVVQILNDLPLVIPPAGFREELRGRLKGLGQKSKTGIITKLTRGKWSGVLAVAASLALTVGVAGAFYGLPGSPKAFDIFSGAAGEKGTAMLQKAENDTGEAATAFSARAEDTLADVNGGTLKGPQVEDNVTGTAEPLANKNFIDFIPAGNTPGADYLSKERQIARAPSGEVTLKEVGQANQKAPSADLMDVAPPPGSRSLTAMGLGGASQEQPLLVKNAILALEVCSVQQAKNSILSLAREFFGKVEQVAPGENQLKVQVPLDKFEAFVEKASLAGKVEKKEIYTQDVTAQWNGVMENIRQLESPAGYGSTPKSEVKGGAAPAEVVPPAVVSPEKQRELEVNRQLLNDIENKASMGSVEVFFTVR